MLPLWLCGRELLLSPPATSDKVEDVPWRICLALQLPSELYVTRRDISSSFFLMALIKIIF